MKQGIVRFLNRRLNGEISPMVYVMMFVSVLTGLTFGFFTGMPDVQNSLIYKFGFPGVDSNLWGAILFMSAGVAFYGLLSHSDEWIKTGSFMGGACWLFLTITYFLHGFFFAGIVYGTFHTIFMAYVYLATTLGFIRRERIL